MEEYYNLLGLKPGASIEEVRKYATSYFHYYNPENLITGNTEMFNKVQDAYNKICKQIQRDNEYELNKGNIIKKGLLDEYIYCALQKYGSVKKVESQLLDGYMSGIVDAITSTNNLRGRFVKNLTASDIQRITNGNLERYIINKSWNRENFEKFSEVYNEWGKEEFAKYLNEQSMCNKNVAEYLESLMPEDHTRMLGSLGYQTVDYVIEDMSLEYFRRLNGETKNNGL